jgi:hypothetical protein
MKILGLDPGKTTGLALIELDGRRIKPPEAYGECKDETLLEIEHLFIEADVIVVEDFKTRPNDARRGAFDWDQMIAPQVIGAAKALAKRHSKLFVLQQASLKPVAYGLSNQKYVPGKKGMHRQDALAHAVFYSVQTLHALPVGNGKS